MNTKTPKIVVIIAAGFGSRLLNKSNIPKPLFPINGRALILRVLDRFAEVGIEKAIIVLGHRALYNCIKIYDNIKAKNIPIKVDFVYNGKYHKGNGYSVLAAKEEVGEQLFFISMADHIFDTSLITKLSKAKVPKDGLVLAVDYRLDQIYDMEDANKVKIKQGRIIKTNKELTDFDAVDTGLFSCTPALFDVLEEANIANKDCHLADGINALISRKKAFACNIKQGYWQDVDTIKAALYAEKIFK